MRARDISIAVALSAALAAALPALATGETVTLPGDAATGPSQNALIARVACPAAGDCVGVGSYSDTDANQQALIDSERGGVWSSSEVPGASLPGAGSVPQPELTGVACAVAGNCTAVGAFDDSASDQQGLIDGEANGSWVPIAAPLAGLAGGVYADPGAGLSLVSCPAVNACVGVGGYSDSNDAPQGLIETQSAAGWSAGEAPMPAGVSASAFAPDFFDLSCPDAGDCAAVGFFGTESDQEGLLESETGGSWSASAVDLSNLSPATGNPQVMVSAVSCPAAGSCTAVGTYENTAGAYAGFAVSESGGRWQATALTLPSDASTTADGLGDPIQNDLFLNGVSCSSAGNCTVVGSYDASSANNVEPFALTETGGSWSSPATTITLPSGEDPPAGDPGAALDSVTCQSAGDCVAAGTYATASGDNVVLVARQSAGAWTTAGADLASPYDPALANMYWASVACAPGGYCATGGYVADDGSGLEDAFMLDAPAATAGTPSATRSGEQASVSWTAPADTGGLPISGYTITVNDLTDPAAGGQTISASAASTSTSVGSLVATDSYSFTVAADSLLGSGLPATSATVAGQPASSGGTGTGKGTTGSGKAASPSRAQIAASLRALLKPHGVAAGLSHLRRTDRYSFGYRALEPGRVTLRWYHRSNTRGHDRVLVAAGTISAKATVTLTVALTKAGRRLVGRRGLRQLRLTAAVSFTGGGLTVARTTGFTLS